MNMAFWAVKGVGWKGECGFLGFKWPFGEGMTLVFGLITGSSLDTW